MRKQTSLLILAVFVGAFLTYVVAVSGQDQPAAGGANKDCNLTYANFGKAFAEKYCTKCHTSENHNFFSRWGAPKGADFDSYDGMKTAAQKIKDMTVTKTKMPKGKVKPTDDERKQLGAWIDCGLPQ